MKGRSFQQRSGEHGETRSEDGDGGRSSRERLGGGEVKEVEISGKGVLSLSKKYVVFFF